MTSETTTQTRADSVAVSSDCGSSEVSFLSSSHKVHFAEDKSAQTVLQAHASNSNSVATSKKWTPLVVHAGDAVTYESTVQSINQKTVFTGNNDSVSSFDFASSEAAKRAAAIKEELGGVVVRPKEGRFAYRAAKRAFDIVFSLLMLVLFCWLYALIALAIKIEDPHGPVIFKQKRVGKNGKLFTMHKFRTMVVDAEDRLDDLRDCNEKTGPVFKIARDPRVTRVGRFLRRVSFDELTQFVDVLKGNMSIVGPRPALPNEAATYNNYQRQRLQIKPGITCYWQTRRNRDTVTFDEWVDLDLLYIKKAGIWTDSKLIIQTIGVVLTAQGS